VEQFKFKREKNKVKNRLGLMINLRAPAAAGTFYDLEKDRLVQQIEACFKHKFGPKKIEKEEFIATIVPHAGYIYSGAVAAWSYSKIPKCNYVIIGPNHQGIGPTFSIMKESVWKTPLGEIATDNNLVEKLMEKCKLLQYDVLAHQYEHSIEVQLPFLQYRFGNDFKFVPISVLNVFADKDFLESCKQVGSAIGNVLKKEKDWIIIASSDFSHYIPHETAEKIDKKLIKAIEKLDEDQFFELIRKLDASVCGFGPIAIALVAAKELGAKKGKLLCYKTSGDITEDFSSVVGYASIILK
jgi:AmmeMemoRadiSam system protein B